MGNIGENYLVRAVSGNLLAMDKTNVKLWELKKKRFGIERSICLPTAQFWNAIHHERR